MYQFLYYILYYGSVCSSVGAGELVSKELVGVGPSDPSEMDCGSCKSRLTPVIPYSWKGVGRRRTGRGDGGLRAIEGWGGRETRAGEMNGCR